MKKNLSIGLSAFALAALLSGCGGGTTTTSTSAAPTSAAASTPAQPSSGAPSSSAPSSSASSMSAAVLSVAQSTAGQIVVGAQGLSVYSFAKDTKDSGTSFVHRRVRDHVAACHLDVGDPHCQWGHRQSRNHSRGQRQIAGDH